MSPRRKKILRRYIPFAISLVLLAILVSYAPWTKVGGILNDFDLSTILILLGLSLAYYFLKTVRFWYLIQAIGINQPFKIVALSYLSAQPISLLPAGEIYRSEELKRQAGVPLETSLPQFTMQGLLEGTAMTLLMVISALALNTLRFVAIGLALLVLVATIGISRGYVKNVTRLANKLPFIDLSETSIRKFSKRHQRVLTWHWLPFLYGLSILIELVGTAIAYVSVKGLGGDINFFEAVLFYTIPIIVGFVSLIPGGFGISEQTAVGVLLLANVSVAQAVSSTIIMRFTIVGLGVLYGCIALVISRELIPKTKRKFNALKYR
jgi:uncharacterized protein (TIRG00374 family)